MMTCEKVVVKMHFVVKMPEMTFGSSIKRMKMGEAIKDASGAKPPQMA